LPRAVGAASALLLPSARASLMLLLRVCRSIFEIEEHDAGQWIFRILTEICKINRFLALFVNVSVLLEARIHGTRMCDFLNELISSSLFFHIILIYKIPGIVAFLRALWWGFNLSFENQSSVGF
jgi:hypothetical protein